MYKLANFEISYFLQFEKWDRYCYISNHKLLSHSILIFILYLNLKVNMRKNNQSIRSVMFKIN